jgi:hypothetical protein
MKNFRHFPRSTQGGLVFRLVMVLAVLALFGAAAWVVLLPSLVVSTIRSKTEFVVKINQLSVNPFVGQIHLSGLVIQNPDYWPEHDFVEVRRFNAAVQMTSLWSDRWVADDVELDIARVVLVKDQRGKLNGMVFSDALSGTPAGGQPPAGAKKQGFLIKRLKLKFDRMTYADYSGGGSAVTKEYKIGIDRELTDVDSVAKLMMPFTGSTLALLNDALGGKYKLDPGMLQNITDMLKGAGKKTGESFKGLIDSLEKKKP